MLEIVLAAGEEIDSLDDCVMLCEIERPQLPSASAGGAGPALAGASGLPDHLMTDGRDL